MATAWTWGVRLGTVTAALWLAVGAATGCSDDNGTSPDAGQPDAGGDVTADAPSQGDMLPPNAPDKVTECNRPDIPPATTGTCSVTAGTKGKLFRGTVLAPHEVLHKGEVLIDDAGMIVCTGCDCSSSPDYAAATVVACADGVISPGLINPHDHITYANNAPVPPSTERYDHRNEWRKGLNGHPPIYTKSGANTQVQLYAELRFVMSGATSLIASGGKKGLARNLDANDPMLHEGVPIQGADYDTFPLDDSDGTMLTSGCAYGSRRTKAATVAHDQAYVPHLGEGVSAAAHNELLCTNNSAGDYNLFQPPTSIIHSVAALPDDAAQMRTDQTRIIWSPRSNLSLYGNTAPVTMYDAMGVPIALGTDWIPSGGMNILRELTCADSLNQKYFGKHFSDADLWRMVTLNAAYAGGAGGVLGALKPGYLADISIFDGKVNKDHRAVIDAGVEDVVLVLRGGKVLYGDDALVADPAIGGQSCESMGDVCGRAKRACVAQDVGGTTTLATLHAAGDPIYPLYFCKDQTPTDEPTCTPYRDTYPNGITATDKDGDGIDDASDDCPDVFNPIRPMDDGKQSDQDSDGIGDACDKCPLDAANACARPNAQDIDGDGIVDDLDDCPRVADPSQADGDGDGVGDACDSCPVKNPGATPCPLSIETIRDPKAANHPPPDAIVVLPPAYVTESVSGANGGFSMQDDTLAPYSGIYVTYGSGASSIKRGNKVVVTGVVIDGFGLGTIIASDVQVVDSGTTLPFSPIPVSTQDIGTGGPLVDTYQSMLLTLSNVTITDDIPDGANSKFYEFVVNGNVRIDDQFYTRYGTPTNGPYPPTGFTKGTTFTTLTGVLGYSFYNSKLWPRDSGDIVP